VFASIIRYRSSVCDGADDVDGVKVVVGDDDGVDDGVDDHDDVKGSQIDLALSLLLPYAFLLKEI